MPDPAQPTLLTAPPGVTLWRLPLERPPAELERLAVLLSAEERRRAERLQPPGAWRRFVAAHGALREILAAALGVEPAALGFAVGPWGKPELAAPFATADLHFNLSHSGELAVLAIATGRPVGVDLERLRPVPRAAELAERYFAAAERADLAEVLGSPAGPTAFFNCWTRKEAFVKAQGQGLAWPLDSFAVTCLPGRSARLVWCAGGDAEAERWDLNAVELGEGYVGALVVGRG